MASNEKLNRAKRAKNDEFYTQYEDVEKEMAQEDNPILFYTNVFMSWIII